MLLNSGRKLFAPEDASSSASPGASTGTASLPATSSPADSTAASTGIAVSSVPEKGVAVAVVEARPAGEEAGSLSEDSIEELLGNGDDELDVEEVPSEPAPTPAVTPKPEAVRVPAVEVSAPVVTPTPAPVVTAPVPTTVVTPQPVVTRTPEQEEADWRKLREDAEAQLVKTYELSKEDADALMVDPGKVFPKLAAKVHIQAYEAAIGAIARNIPTMIAQTITQQTQAQQHKENFFSQFPELRKHEDVAAHFITAHRQADPKADPNEIVKRAGLAAYVHLNLPLTGLAGITAVAPPAPTPIPATPPFVPAAPAAGAIPTGKKVDNAFTKMAEEFLADDS